MYNVSDHTPAFIKVVELKTHSSYPPVVFHISGRIFQRQIKLHVNLCLLWKFAKLSQNYQIGKIKRNKKDLEPYSGEHIKAKPNCAHGRTGRD